MRKYLAYNMPIELQTIKKTFFADSKKTIATNKSNFMNDYIHINVNIYIQTIRLGIGIQTVRILID